VTRFTSATAKSGNLSKNVNRHNSNLIDEHVEGWIRSIPHGHKDSFEGRLAIIKNELVVKREQIYREQQKSQRAQRELLSEEQLLVFKSLEDELNEGNYHLLAKPADEFEI
jgi:hypothetical protein